MIEKRKPVFIERLSYMLVIFSAIGATIVLLDPIVTFTTANGTVIKLGGDGFSDQIKGAVISLVLVSGFAAVITYWLGASNQGVKAQESVNTIAQAAAPATAAAVAASRSEPVPATVAPIVADDVTVQAQGNVTVEGNK